MFDDICDVGCDMPDVERDGDEAALFGCAVAFGELNAVGRKNADAVALGEPGLCESIDQTVHALIELGEGPLLSFADERDLVWIGRRIDPDDVR